MGSVYLAFDVELQREVAVKVIRPEWLASPDAAGRFRREARAAALLSHPHVVTVHDFGVADDDRAYLVMERLIGRTLREALREHGSLAAPLACEILRGVCAAVSLAHRHRLLHRDLKPENIFLARSDEREIAKVLDFGLVKPLAPSQSDAVTGTATGGLLGTFGYMSPEQLRGEPPAESWDVWALAVVAFEMLTGTHPFALDGDPRGPFAAARAITLAPAPALAPALRGFFERALAAERALRPRSVPDLIAQLDVALGVCVVLPG
jgi:serine/threonine-protein kinase